MVPTTSPKALFYIRPFFKALTQLVSSDFKLADIMKIVPDKHDVDHSTKSLKRTRRGCTAIKNESAITG